MARKLVECADGQMAPRVCQGDRGRIWKCYDFQRMPIGYLVTGGKNGVRPIAYVGTLPLTKLPTAPAGARIRYPHLDPDSLFETAVRIATRFERAAAGFSGKCEVRDLRDVDLRNYTAVRKFLFAMVLKPTAGTSRAARYYFAGARFKFFREKPQDTMGVAMFHAKDEQLLFNPDADYALAMRTRSEAQAAA